MIILTHMNFYLIKVYKYLGVDILNILMVSFLTKEKEGRFNRAYNSIKKEHKVYVIDVDDKEVFSNERICLKLKNTNSLFRYFEFAYKVIKASKQFNFDTIYAHNYFTCLPAIIISKMSNKRLIYDAYELYYPAGKKAFSIRDRFFYFFEKKTIKNANEVICANNERALIMTGHYNLEKLPTVIQNIAKDDSQVYITVKNICDMEIIKIVYAGYLAMDRSILELISAIQVNKYKSRINLHIYGNGPLLAKLIAMSEEKQYSFVEVKGSYLNSDLNLILNNYHIGYISYPNTDFNNIFCSPNKIFDYAVNGLVILASHNYGLSTIISKYKIGYCDYNISDAISNVIINYNDYRNNLKIFLDDNKWSDEEMKLLCLLNNKYSINSGV